MGPEDLRQRRKALKMTQNELAEKLGLSGNTVSRWEKGLVSSDTQSRNLALAFIIHLWANTDKTRSPKLASKIKAVFRADPL
jgi:transcriptional regulator with XRE-family HTH domain